jgi:predicted O-methyltransferase YrrM
MSAGTIQLTPALRDYLVKVSVREPDVLTRLRTETQAMPQANMQISEEQGQLMALLVQLVGVKRGLEVGTFTGYSALAVARVLADDAELHCFDRSEEWTNVARRYWAEAGVDHKIHLHLGDALPALDQLIADGQTGQFDYAFVDADKGNYPEYHERCVRLVRSGGVILYDNVLWSGAVIDAHDDSVDTAAIRALNARLRDDPRVDLSMIPIGDGLTVCRRR